MWDMDVLNAIESLEKYHQCPLEDILYNEIEDEELDLLLEEGSVMFYLLGVDCTIGFTVCTSLRGLDLGTEYRREFRETFEESFRRLLISGSGHLTIQHDELQFSHKLKCEMTPYYRRMCETELKRFGRLY